MNRIESLPFNTYDVIGYLTPGFLMISWIISLFLAFSDIGFDVINHDFSLAIQILIIVLITTASYALGHAIAIGSSESIERISISFFGLPSSYLIDDKKINAKECLCRCYSYHMNNKRMIPNILLFIPIYLIILIYCVFGDINILVKKIGKNEKNMLKSKFEEKYKISIDNSEDWFSLCAHYCISHNQFTAQRAYNYVVIYGFCRNMTFVANFILYFGGIFLLVFSEFISENFQILFYLIIPIASLYFSFTLVLSFIKFQRRYSEEIIKSFIAMHS